VANLAAPPRTTAPMLEMPLAETISPPARCRMVFKSFQVKGGRRFTVIANLLVFE
jgi:hypothetical protein